MKTNVKLEETKDRRRLHIGSFFVDLNESDYQELKKIFVSQLPASVTDEDIRFGDYITVEQKRFGAPNEHYTHKVIGTLKSNTWIDVPAMLHVGKVIHDTVEPVVNCIVEGVCEEEVIRYRVCDVKKVMRSLLNQSPVVGEGWVSVSKKNPPFDKHVLVFCRIYGFYIGSYQRIDDTNFGNWNDGKELGVLPPTHWHELPSPPHQANTSGR